MDLTWLSVTLAMLGKFAINSSFCIIYIYGPEIYPTVLRLAVGLLMYIIRMISVHFDLGDN